MSAIPVMRVSMSHDDEDGTVDVRVRWTCQDPDCKEEHEQTLLRVLDVVTAPPPVRAALDNFVEVLAVSWATLILGVGHVPKDEPKGAPAGAPLQ
jgi:hypothetical protein